MFPVSIGSAVPIRIIPPRQRNVLGPLVLFTSSVMATFRPDLIVSAARHWDKLGLVVVITPDGRKLKRCGYVGDVDYFKHATWLQVPDRKSVV